MTDLLSNIPELTVSDLSRALKKTVEDAFGHVRVRGELSRVTIARSGHLYSDLKDENAVLNIVCWKGTVQKLALRPEEGMEVICTGRLTTFPGSSKYQMVVESMELAGEGALLKLLEERKRRLGEEGLFDEIRKQPLPFLPKVIGVVTSPTGAVIRDIIHRIRDRFPCHVIVWPVVVQGQGAADQITRAIEGFNRVKTDNRPDVIIVARGGGSLEDLMAFNEENVVRAAAASAIPLISAVGHETDVTLIDFASDQRAPTPTGAAEMAVPVRDNLMAQVLDDGLRLGQGLKRIIHDGDKSLQNAARVLSQPKRLIEAPQQRFDMAADKLNHIFERRLGQADTVLARLSGRLQTPAARFDQAQISLTALSDRMIKLPKEILDKRMDGLDSASRMLETLSYKSILNRGYAVLRGDDDMVLDTADDVKKSKKIRAIVKDGAVDVR